MQQTSDTTYRVFDYNRIDKDGKKRDLHLSKALDVINVPDNAHFIKKSPSNKYNQFITLVENNKFKMSYLKKNSYPFILQKYNYLIGFLLSGSLIIDDHPIEPYSFFLIPFRAKPIIFKGEFEGLFIESTI